MHLLQFTGKGIQYLKLSVQNFFLILFSLTLLSPKALIRDIRYLSTSFELADKPFDYSAKSKDALGFYVYILGSYILLFFVSFLFTKWFQQTQIPFFAFPVFFIVITALSLVSSALLTNEYYKLQLNFLQWNQWSFKWTGNVKGLLSLFTQGFILNMLTLSLFTPWYQTKLYRYLYEHIHFGEYRFEFDGAPSNLFKIYLKNLLLGILTLGIYLIWGLQKEFNFLMEHSMIVRGDHKIQLGIKANTLEIFELYVGNILIVLLTLGIGTPFAIVRYLKFMAQHTYIPESILERTEY